MATFSAERRKQLAKEGKALPDGSYPTPTLSDLMNAIQAFGRETGDRARLKAYLMRRARALGASEAVRQRISLLKVG